MNQSIITSLQRVLITLDHKEPDRVPFFLLALSASEKNASSYRAGPVRMSGQRLNDFVDRRP